MTTTSTTAASIIPAAAAVHLVAYGELMRRRDRARDRAEGWPAGEFAESYAGDAERYEAAAMGQYRAWVAAAGVDVAMSLRAAVDAIVDAIVDGVREESA